MKIIAQLLPLLFFIPALFAQDATTVYKNTVSSTVTIETNNKLGSGFFVGENIIVTNYHVIEGATKAICYVNGSSIKYKIEGYLSFDKSIDLILLKVIGLNREPIKIASDSISPGEKVYVLGSPEGLQATISDGIVSGLRDFGGHILIQITAPISSGSSGGPVINSKGEVIGVSVGQLKDGQNLNFAIPIKYIHNLKTKFLTVQPIAKLKKPIVQFKSTKIGGQIWMAENLSISKFRNGDEIPEAKTGEEWEDAYKEERPVWCYYDNYRGNGEKYGKLYNWYAVIDYRGLAPEGWHVPDVSEWEYLIGYSGGEEMAGERLKSKTGWNWNETFVKSGNGNNKSQFNAMPGGYRPNEGRLFYYVGENSYWWSTTLTKYHLYMFSLSHEFSNAFIQDGASKSWGLYVRCIKD